LKLSKGRAFGLWAIGLVLTVIAVNQVWFTLEMQPEDTTVVIQSFSGANTYGYISPTLLLIASQSAFFFFVGPRARFWIGSLSILTTLGFAVALLLEILQQNISSLASAVEAATGIAAQHGIKGVTVVTEIGGYLTLGTLALTLVIQSVTLSKSRIWPKKVARTERKAVAIQEPEDTISLWDSQR
jgi:hypothetical protein